MGTTEAVTDNHSSRPEATANVSDGSMETNGKLFLINSGCLRFVARVIFVLIKRAVSKIPLLILNCICAVCLVIV